MMAKLQRYLLVPMGDREEDCDDNVDTWWVNPSFVAEVCAMNPRGRVSCVRMNGVERYQWVKGSPGEVLERLALAERSRHAEEE